MDYTGVLLNDQKVEDFSRDDICIFEMAQIRTVSVSLSLFYVRNLIKCQFFEMIIILCSKFSKYPIFPT